VTAAVFQTEARFCVTFTSYIIVCSLQCCEFWKDAELRDRAVCAVTEFWKFAMSGSQPPSATTDKALVWSRIAELLYSFLATP